ncbi:MAG: hypothetical protein JXB48_19255 [Candidatus Latescibacteria bacterium]|nr:hypothetical protein [Candidatus Latescibacterota bacterium]
MKQQKDKEIKEKLTSPSVSVTNEITYSNYLDINDNNYYFSKDKYLPDVMNEFNTGKAEII